ncbi:MAG TPA: hypothetical protein VEO73_04310, partial [Gemmatimonadales bacterium]|nr:hypothetical protein [Gemmatimonadales bacterium]
GGGGGGGGGGEETAVRTASAAAVDAVVGVGAGVAVLDALNRSLRRYRNRRLHHHLQLNQER